MKIAKIKTDNIIKALEKFSEELIELKFAKNKQEELSEGFDVIQALFSVFYARGYTKEEIRSHMKLHYQKLEQRHEEGRITIEEWSEY